MHADKDLLEIDICDGVGELVGFGFAAVAKDDYGELLFGDAEDVGAEADGAAAVADGLCAVVIAEFPAEAVGDGLTAGEDRWGPGVLQRGGTDELVRVERLVPEEEVVDGGVDAAIAEDGAGEALVGAFEGAVLLAVSVGAILHRRDAFFEGNGLMHLER